MDEYETDMKEIYRVTRAISSTICFEEGGQTSAG